MYISYSGFKLYSACKLAYWHTYVRETEPPEPDNAVNALYGSVVGRIFEDFYTQRIWRQKDFQKALQDLVEPTYQKVVHDEVRRGRVLRWQTPQDKKPNYSSPEELLADVRDTIPRGLRIIRHDRLVGPRTEAETKLDSVVKGHTIGGRADFIIERVKPHHDLVILDGKGSKHRGSFVDPRQLKWYAMLYSLRNNGALPDKLGFVYWRFDPPESLDWVAFSQSDTDELLEEVLEAVAEIERAVAHRAESNKSFPPRPSRENCRFCSYLKICPKGKEAMDPKTHTGV
jgi:hypothetical protein